MHYNPSKKKLKKIANCKNISPQNARNAFLLTTKVSIKYEVVT